MLDIQMATQIIQKELPHRRIVSHVSYKDLWVFQAFDDNDSLEGEFDPFYSVNKTTGEFNEFSILTDGDTAELQRLFQQANGGS